MNKFWKALGIAALAAAVPVRFKKDEATGKKTYQSLLISVDVGPGEDGGKAIGINIGEGVFTNAIASLMSAKKETHLFADDDPEAAVVHGEVIDFAQAAADQAQVAADEGQTATDEAQAATDEAQADVDEAQATVEEATEEDFDPEM